MSVPATRARLERLLALVPAAHARPGIRVEDLARQLACTPDDLRADLDLLACVGAPPFDPDDLIDIELKGDRVYVTLSQAFERPTRLTATEAAALSLAARALAPDDLVLKSALDRLSNAVAPSQREVYSALVAHVPPAPAADEALNQTIEEAARARREIELVYFDRSSPRASARVVRPRAFGAIDGVTYLSAQKPEGEERLYRLDRMVRARLLETTFAPLPPVNLERELKRLARVEGRTDLPRATVRFTASVAVEARRRHPAAHPLAGGGVEASVPYFSLPYLLSYALSWGGEAEIVGPEEARQALREAVAAAIAQHAG